MTTHPSARVVMACAMCACVAVAHGSAAATIRVPSDYPSIQQAIDAAVPGDTVVVAPGVYYENINFLGKDITVTSEQGPAVTVIDGHNAGSVATFKSSETRNAVLAGFTLQGGYGTGFGGGGVAILSASPTIRDNIISDNYVCGSGGGISSLYGSPLIQHNTIARNHARFCTGMGLGIYVYGNSTAEIVDNLITANNDTGVYSVIGGGITLFAAGNVTVRRNVISQNVIAGPYGCGYGGGLDLLGNVRGVITDNLIVRNRACRGAGVEWFEYSASNGSTVFTNNTVADNEAAFGAAAVYLSGVVDNRNTIENNIIAARSGPALSCNNVQGATLPVLVANDVYRVDLPASSYAGTCPDQTGLNGNISADPLFLDAAAGDYRVWMNSPVIDAGNDGAPGIASVDLAGGARIVDGDGDGADRVDLGGLEYRNHAPVANAGDDRTAIAGADCTAVVTLNGSGSDPDGDTLTYTWTGPFGTVAGPAVTASLAAGTHVATLTVTDGNGGFASDTVTITVLDTAAPTIGAVTATPAVILQASHQMVPIVVAVAAADCDPHVWCRIVSVTSNEPVDGLGDGDTAPDWEITGDLTLNVRAERAGNGTGRIYTITVACTDGSGNTSTATVTVTVPHDS